MPYAELSAPSGLTVIEGQAIEFDIFFREITNVDITYSYGFSSNSTGTAEAGDFGGGQGNGTYVLSSTIPQSKSVGTFSLGATQDTIAEGDETFFLNVSLTGITFENGSSNQAFEITIIDNAPPQGGVTVIGTAAEDQTLIADTSALSDADGLGPLSYQWLRDGVAVSGATTASYTLGNADTGAQMSVRVSYVDGVGTAETTTSAVTSTVVNVNDAPQGSVTVSGSAVEDQTLTALPAITDADGLGVLSYQWLRDGVSVGGANAASYTLTDADVGAQMSVRVSYTDGGGTAEVVSSGATDAVVNVNDAPQGSVTITGSAVEDQTLTAVPVLADADGLGALSYQWLRDGTAIADATMATYTLDDADVGAQVSVRVSYTDARGTAEAVTSAATAAVGNVNDAPQGGVTITGEVRESQTLTAVSALTDADGLGVLSYQWLRDGVAIAGATMATYTLADTDVGTAVSVQVSYTDDGGTAEAVSSAATGAVSGIDILLEGTDADETLLGDQGNDTLIGNEGNDTIYGYEGDDGLFGGDNDDTIFGGTGDDTLAGAEGNDVIDGEPGDDQIGGGEGDDIILGGTGDDVIGAGFGDDTADGGAGDDIVNGGPGDDSLDGGAGDDTMGGSFGDDTVIGNDGNDSLGGGAGSDSIDAGAGNDTVGGGEGDDTIDGGAGDDFLAGGGRNDVIDGGAGDDQINAGDGDDTVTGGAGDDQFIFNGFNAGDADVITDWTDGEDTFRMTGIENAPGSGLQGYLDALNVTATADGVQMSYEGHVITLLDADLADLGLEDFTFL